MSTAQNQQVTGSLLRPFDCISVPKAYALDRLRASASGAVSSEQGWRVIRDRQAPIVLHRVEKFFAPPRFGEGGEVDKGILKQEWQIILPNARFIVDDEPSDVENEGSATALAYVGLGLAAKYRAIRELYSSAIEEVVVRCMNIRPAVDATANALQYSRSGLRRRRMFESALTLHARVLGVLIAGQWGRLGLANPQDLIVPGAPQEEIDTAMGWIFASLLETQSESITSAQLQVWLDGGNYEGVLTNHQAACTRINHLIRELDR